MVEDDELTLPELFAMLDYGQVMPKEPQRSPLNLGKKRGRPSLSAAPQTAAQRQRARRERLAAAPLKDFNEWTDAECLAILASSKYRESDVDELAWRRLGELRDFL